MVTAAATTDIDFTAYSLYNIFMDLLNIELLIVEQ
jgi:hypothetical protein